MSGQELSGQKTNVQAADIRGRQGVHSPDAHDEGKTRLNAVDIFWTVLILVLFAFMAYIFISPKGLQLVGARARVLCGVSALFLLLLGFARVYSMIRGGTAAYLSPGLVALFIPLTFLPVAGKIQGGTALAIERGFRGNADALRQNAPGKMAQISPIPASGTITLSPANYRASYDALYADPSKYKGREFSSEGFAMPLGPEENAPIALGRILIWCCPADGTLLGFQVKLPEGEPSPKGQTWLKVQGVFDTETMPETQNPDGSTSPSQTVPILKLTSLSSVAMPADPYLYP